MFCMWYSVWGSEGSECVNGVCYKMCWGVWGQSVFGVWYKMCGGVRGQSVFLCVV